MFSRNPHLKQLGFKISDWMLPPKIKSVLTKHFFKKQAVTIDGSGGKRIYRGLHAVPFFNTVAGRIFWSEFNGEYRPTITSRRSIAFRVRQDTPFQWIQFGIGTRERNTIPHVRIFIDNDLKASLFDVQLVPRGPESGEWHDVRIPLTTATRSAIVRVESSGDAEIYISHPEIGVIKNKHDDTRRARNVICIVLDGVSRDFLRDDTTPHITRFFKKGMRYTQAYTQGDWTLPAFSSMLTGRYPSRHGVHVPKGINTFLPDDMETLPQRFLENGFRTFGYSSHKRFMATYGHAKGFERFIYRPLNHKEYYPTIINEATQHLETHREENNFLFLHFFDTHPPFEPSGYRRSLEKSRFRHVHRDLKKINVEERLGYYFDALSATLKEVDTALETFFLYLQNQPWFEDTLVMLTADHGITPIVEGKPLLLQHRVNVPLLIRGPGVKEGEESTFVEGSVDLMPSLLAAADIKGSYEGDGRPWPCLGGKQRDHTFSESLYGDLYQAAIRTHSKCVHLKCPLDLKARTVRLSKKQLVVYKRENGLDQEDKEIPINKEHPQTKGTITAFERYLKAACESLRIN